jgi:stage IV sporulation protein B
MYFLPAMQSYSHIPSDIYVLRGSTRTIDLGLPVKADVKSPSVINITSESLSDAVGMQSPLTIEPVSDGKTVIELSFLGIPVKTVNVNVSESIVVIPGGQSIGVALDTKGALVVGITGVELSNGDVANPAREAGMLPGDVILSINGVEIDNAYHLREIINQQQGVLSIKIDRNGRILDLNMLPVRDPL